MSFFVLMEAMALLMSRGMTSPRYNIQQDMYLPVEVWHLTSWLSGLKHSSEMSFTEMESWFTCCGDTNGAYETSGKWMRGNGTKFVWNSVFAVKEESSSCWWLQITVAILVVRLWWALMKLRNLPNQILELFISNRALTTAYNDFLMLNLAK